MNICVNPFAITQIKDDDYIGTSLQVINNNFAALKDAVCTQNEQIVDVAADFTTYKLGVSALSAILPGFAKAWVNFNGTGTPSIFSSQNVASVSSLGTGVYQLSFVPAFANISYALVGSCTQTVSPGVGFTWVQPTTAFTNSTARINIRSLSGSTVDSPYISIIAYST